MRWWTALGLLGVLVACTPAPYTNRSQLILISSSQENQLGAQAFADVVAKNRLDQRASIVGPVQAVGQRLAAVANRPDFQWQFVVIDSPEVNAFCLPGGKVAVYTGMLPVAEDTTGLAVVLGHEISHAIARHGAERMSQQLAAEVGGALLGEATGANAGLVMAAYGLTAQYGVLLPWSRTQESEADRIGLELMARAGYDPRAAVAFWERMARAGGGRVPEFLSTHPSSSTRIAQIDAWIPAATRLYDAASKAPVTRLPNA